MSYVDDLLDAYRKFVVTSVARDSGAATAGVDGGLSAGARAPPSLASPGVQGGHNERHHPWALSTSATSFETWMAGHRYREAYFEDPDLLETALPAFFDHLVADVRAQLGSHASAESVVALLGAGTLFGLGDA